MTCDEVTDLIDAFLDGELDAATARAVTTHLADCARCAELLADTKALSVGVRTELPALAAPDDLRARIERAIRADVPLETGRTAHEAQDQPKRIRTVVGEGRPPGQRSRSWASPGSEWLIAAGLMVVVGLGSWRLGVMRGISESGMDAGSVLRDAVVASHLRSLEANHLVDVASSDRHTVKPWFAGKVDFAPNVPDLAPKGFPLIGGRLDYVDAHPAVALVYGRSRHVINVLVWPGPDTQTVAVVASSVRGFHLRHWAGGGMAYWAISDVADPDLDSLVVLLRTGGSGTAP